MQQDPLVHVQEEPACEIAIPQVFTQPPLATLTRGRLANPEALVARIHRRAQDHPEEGLGRDYQELVTEFQPLFAWAIASWDYLLSTEGCRFVPRTGDHKVGARGDYRAVTDGDFSRLVHRIFRACVLDFAATPEAPSLSHWLRDRFWPSALAEYRRLDQPMDPRHRALTPYSYLRCVPYQFLNDYHHDLVYATLERLPDVERQAIATYFLHFHTETATAETLGCAAEACLETLRQGLIKLLVNDRLVYCLLRQIERY